MTDSDQRPLLKSAATDVIISNHGTIKVHSQIGVLFNFSDPCGIYWLGLGLGLGLWHTSVTAFDVDLRK